VAPRGTPIGELMTTPPVVAYEGTWFSELVRAMAEKEVGCLPIVDRQERLVGVVTDADLLLRACRPWLEERERGPHESASRRLDRIRAGGVVARDLMTSPALTAPPSMRARDALELLRRHGVKHLIVEGKGGAALGVLSRRDLLVPLCRHDDEIRADVADAADRVLRVRRAGVMLDVDDGAVRVSGPLPGPLRARLVEELGAVEGVVAVRVEPLGAPVMADVREVMP
jgi:CBS domain-containing protein